MYIDQLNLAGKKILVRVDFNVPLDNDNNVTDDTRIIGALETINYALDRNAIVILMSHLGRPQKKKNADGSINKEKFSLKHIVSCLSEHLGREVKFANDTIGDSVEKIVSSLNQGEVLLLENTRFYKEEKNGDKTFAEALSKLADIYINDAFGTAHRSHASTATVAEFFSKENKGLGFLIKKELVAAARLIEMPQRPFTAIVGGAKVSDKILLLEKLLDNVNNIIIGGGMAYTLIKAQGGEVGSSLLEEDKIEVARSFLLKAKEKNVNVYLPEDSVIADAFNNEANADTVLSNQISAGWMGLDIGERAVRSFGAVIKSSKSLLWNGPMGVFEFTNFSRGTFSIADAVVEATKDGAYSLIGGGDSVAAINKAGKADEVSFVSTGGGAMLKLLEGGELPGLEAIK